MPLGDSGRAQASKTPFAGDAHWVGPSEAHHVWGAALEVGHHFPLLCTSETLDHTRVLPEAMGTVSGPGACLAFEKTEQLTLDTPCFRLVGQVPGGPPSVTIPHLQDPAKAETGSGAGWEA